MNVSSEAMSEALHLMSTLFDRKKKLEIIITPEDPEELLPQPPPTTEATGKENKTENHPSFLTSTISAWQWTNLFLKATRRSCKSFGFHSYNGKVLLNRWLEFPWLQFKWIPSCPLPVHRTTKPASTTWAGPTIIWPSAFHFPISVGISNLTECGGKQALD